MVCVGSRLWLERLHRFEEFNRFQMFDARGSRLGAFISS